MKKAFFLLASLVLLCLLLVPGLIGMSLEDEMMEELIQAMTEQSPATIERVSHEGGWFQSRALFEVSYPGAALFDFSSSGPGSGSGSGHPLAGDITVELDMAIRHGPLLLTRGGPRFGLAYAEILPDIKGYDLRDFSQLLPVTLPADFASPEISYTYLARFNQSSRLTVDVGPVLYQEGEATLEISGLAASLDMASDQSARSHVQVGLSELSGPGLNMRLSGARFDSRTDNMMALIAPGESSLAIPRLEMQEPLQLSIGELTAGYEVRRSRSPTQASERAESQAAEQGPVYDLEQTLQVGEINSSLPLEALSWRLAVSQLDGELFNAYFNFLEEARAEPSLDEAALEARIARLSEDFTLMLINEPMNLLSRLDLEAYGGPHSLEVALQWPGMPGVQRLGDFDQGHALRAIQGNLQLEADQQALMLSPVGVPVMTLIQQGVLQASNGKVMVEGEMVNGRLTLNGQVIPVDQLLSL